MEARLSEPSRRTDPRSRVSSCLPRRQGVAELRPRILVRDRHAGRPGTGIVLRISRVADRRAAVPVTAVRIKEEGQGTDIPIVPDPVVFEPDDSLAAFTLDIPTESPPGHLALGFVALPEAVSAGIVVSATLAHRGALQRGASGRGQRGRARRGRGCGANRRCSLRRQHEAGEVRLWYDRARIRVRFDRPRRRARVSLIGLPLNASSPADTATLFRVA